MAKLLHEPLPLLLLQAAAIIALSRGLGMLVRRFRQPLVIAEIVAGILLGPSLFGWLSPNASGALFPPQSMGLLGIVSQMGLVLFMFVIGLELDPKLLRGRTHTSVAISHSSIIVPFALGCLLAFYLYPRVSQTSVPFTSFALFLGTAMSITAFPVLARILAERRLLRSRLGAVTITCAAVDDVTAWCMLAFVVSLVRSTGIFGAVHTSLLAIAYIAAMVWGVRPFLKKLADRTQPGLTQNIVAAVIVLLLVSSSVTDLIGIHALFGAFLLGAILPKGSLSVALIDKVEDIVVVLLLPLFFAYSGLRTQIGLLSTPGSWALCALIIVAASVGKFGGSAVAARLTGLSWRESSALGILMNTRGLMELIILNIGLDVGVISPTLFTMMVVMALVTTFLTTPVLERIYPAEQFARDLLAEPEEPIPAVAAVQSYTALVCVAYEQSGAGLLTVASAIAGKEDAASRLYALSLVGTDRPSLIMRHQGEPATRHEPAALAAVTEQARALGAHVRPLSFISTNPAKDICDVAEVKRANLILLGWHKPIIGRAMLGGTVHRVMQQANADVAMLLDRGLEQMTRLLVPYLGSTHDRAALRMAHRIAEHTGASVTVLHVVLPNSEGSLRAQERLQEEFVESTGARAYDVSFKAVPHSVPSTAVLDESQHGYDLILIGVSRLWELEHRAFGVQREPILAGAACSVLAVRQGQIRAGVEARVMVQPSFATIR